MTLGGQDRDGNDQSNELSSLCIDATIALHIHQPALSVRWHTNVYDGLMAIKRCVCEKKLITWTQLHEALLNDFEEAEAIRQMLINSAPKFGNGIEKVDNLANEINAIHADFSWKQVDSRNGRYTCGVWPVTAHVGAGHWVAATPDGRHKGTPLVDGVGACQGVDVNGPTALLQSVANLNNIEHWPAGNVCNIKFSKSSISSDEGINNLMDLTTAYMELGGQQLQINVVDTETLRNAKAHPELYSDLIVRVAGYSAYFTQLSLDVQDEIIMRNEHKV